MKKRIFGLMITLLLIGSFVCAGESLLIQYQKAGIWKVDRPNHRCLVDPGVWNRIPFDQKEKVLQIIYVEENTWWEIYDMYSGKLLGKVSSWGWKIYP
jgi:hypothetical protein